MKSPIRFLVRLFCALPCLLLLLSCAQHALPPAAETPGSPDDIPQWGAPPPPPANPEDEARKQEEAKKRAIEARERASQQRANRSERERRARIQAEQERLQAEKQDTQNSNYNQAIKQFPWPPPKPSSFSLIQRKYLPITSTAPKLSEIESMIRESLDATGYYDVSYYGLNSQADAFAMATRLEQINPDATPKLGEERWIGALESEQKFSLKTYLNDLFYAEQGAYRIIVFIVTTKSFAFSKKSVSARKAQSWVSDGNVSLPEELASNVFTKQHKVYALIYEFDKNSDQSAKESVNLRIPGKHQTRTHLENSGIWKLITQDVGDRK